MLMSVLDDQRNPEDKDIAPDLSTRLLLQDHKIDELAEVLRHEVHSGFQEVRPEFQHIRPNFSVCDPNGGN
jgi:hypothetical protein